MSAHYITKLSAVEAVQLTQEGRSNNGAEVAEFCEGSTTTVYSPKSGETTVKVEGDVAHQFLDRHFVYVGDWVVKHADGMLEVLTSEQFYKRYAHLTELPKEVCQTCLADPRFTPQGDPEDVNCDECGARYTGSARTQEFNILHEAGIAMVIR